MEGMESVFRVIGGGRGVGSGVRRRGGEAVGRCGWRMA